MGAGPGAAQQSANLEKIGVRQAHKAFKRVQVFFFTFENRLRFGRLVLLLAGFEGLDLVKRSPGFYLVVLFAAAAAGVFMVIAWRRFGALLARAEGFASGATCPECSAWGKFEVLAEERTTPDDPPESGRPHWLRVRCRKCSRDWRIG